MPESKQATNYDWDDYNKGFDQTKQHEFPANEDAWASWNLGQIIARAGVGMKIAGCAGILPSTASTEWCDGSAEALCPTNTPKLKPLCNNHAPSKK